MRAVMLLFWMTVTVVGCGDAQLGGPPPGGDAATGDTGLPPDPDAAQSDGAPVLDADARACVGGDAKVTDPKTGICYVYGAARVPWDEAALACADLGGWLAVPTDPAEVALLTALSLDPSGAPDVWLGGTDAALEGTWEWIDGEPFVFENWRINEPNDGGVNGEDCMVLESDTDGTWDDRGCTVGFPYFCEIP